MGALAWSRRDCCDDGPSERVDGDALYDFRRREGLSIVVVAHQAPHTTHRKHAADVTCCPYRSVAPTPGSKFVTGLRAMTVSQTRYSIKIQGQVLLPNREHDGMLKKSMKSIFNHGQCIRC